MSKWTLVLSSSHGMLKIIFISSPGAQIEDIELMNFFSGPDLIEMASSEESLLHLPCDENGEKWQVWPAKPSKRCPFWPGKPS